jgi:hypothetical protein
MNGAVADKPMKAEQLRTSSPVEQIARKALITSELYLDVKAI